MELTLAAGTFLAAIGATYFFCVRPMRQGRHCAMSRPTDPNVTAGHAAAGVTGVTGADLKAARSELEALRAAMAASANAESALALAPGNTGATASRPNGLVGRSA